MEAQTRKDLIDPAIAEAELTAENSCLVLVEPLAFVPGRVGRIRDNPKKADYVLTYRGRRLVVIEAKSDEIDTGCLCAHGRGS